MPPGLHHHRGPGGAGLRAPPGRDRSPPLPAYCNELYTNNVDILPFVKNAWAPWAKPQTTLPAAKQVKQSVKQ